MNIKKSLWLIFPALLINLFLFNTGLTQTKRADETIFLSGPVQELAWVYQTIRVNNKKFFFSHDTQVVDQKGNLLKISDVKNNADIAIDAVRQSNGYMIKKIVVITDRSI